MSQIHHECELERHIVEQLAASGWQVGDPAAYDKARALFPADVITWLQTICSQSDGRMAGVLGGLSAVAAVQ